MTQGSRDRISISSMLLRPACARWPAALYARPSEEQLRGPLQHLHPLRHKELSVLPLPLTPLRSAPDTPVPANEASNGSILNKRHQRRMTNETDECSARRTRPPRQGSGATQSENVSP